VNPLINTLKLKEKVRKELLKSMDRASISKALGDYHAQRAPRPCGITIHTGIGCDFGCIYCYIPDMGFPRTISPYPLNGAELVLALSTNPYVFPGPIGTLAAFGSVTEPLHKKTIEKTLEYLEYISKYLKLPVQMSTKAVVNEEIIDKIKEIEPDISTLITIITLNKSKILEPGAPPPMDRFEFMKTLSNHGVHVVLFLRPIIPGVTDREVEKIIKLAADYGAQGIVPGTLRVTYSMINRLRKAGINISTITSLMPYKPKKSYEQVPLKGGKFKELAIKIARDYSLKVYPSACAANIDAHKQACYACSKGPCGNLCYHVNIEENHLLEVLEYFNIKGNVVRIAANKVELRITSKITDHIVNLLKNLIFWCTRRRPIIHLR